jgi:hypothetical protein
MFGLIVDLFWTALVEGWAGECIATFEEEGGEEILEALREVEDDRLAAGIDELGRRIEEWKWQNNIPHGR